MNNIDYLNISNEEFRYYRDQAIARCQEKSTKIDALLEETGLLLPKTTRELKIKCLPVYDSEFDAGLITQLFEEYFPLATRVQESLIADVDNITDKQAAFKLYHQLFTVVQTDYSEKSQLNHKIQHISNYEPKIGFMILLLYANLQNSKQSLFALDPRI